MNPALKKQVEEVIGPFSITGVYRKYGTPCVISDQNKKSVRLKFVRREWTYKEETELIKIPGVLKAGGSQMSNSLGFQGATIHFDIDIYKKDCKRVQQNKNLK